MSIDARSLGKSEEVLLNISRCYVTDDVRHPTNIADHTCEKPRILRGGPYKALDGLQRDQTLVTVIFWANEDNGRTTFWI